MSAKYDFKILKKKLEKVDQMMKGMDSSEPKYRKLEKKRQEYFDQMKLCPEWNSEKTLMEKKERLLKETRRLKAEAQAAEGARKRAEENSRNAEMEARRKREEDRFRRIQSNRREHEEFRREAEKQARLNAENEARRQREEEERRREEERRKNDEALCRAENERLQAQEEQERFELEESERIEAARCRAEESLEKEKLERKEREKERNEREHQERLEHERQERIEQERSVAKQYAARLKAEEEICRAAEQEEPARLKSEEDSRFRARQEEDDRLKAEEETRITAEQDASKLKAQEKERIAVESTVREEKEKADREAAAEAAIEEKNIPSAPIPAWKLRMTRQEVPMPRHSISDNALQVESKPKLEEIAMESQLTIIANEASEKNATTPQKPRNGIEDGYLSLDDDSVEKMEVQRFTVVVHNDRYERLGLGIKKLMGVGGIFVSGIRPDSKIALTDLEPDMELISINGDPCPSTVPETLVLIRATKGELSIVAEKTTVTIDEMQQKLIEDEYVSEDESISEEVFKDTTTVEIEYEADSMDSKESMSEEEDNEEEELRTAEEEERIWEKVMKSEAEQNGEEEEKIVKIDKMQQKLIDVKDVSEDEIIAEEIFKDNATVESQYEVASEDSYESISEEEDTEEEVQISEEEERIREEVTNKEVDEQNEEEISTPSHPPQSPIGSMGGLFAEMAAKKKKMDTTRKPIEEEIAPPSLIPVSKEKSAVAVTAAVPPSDAKEGSTLRAQGEGDEVSGESLSRQSITETGIQAQSQNTNKVLQEIAATEKYHKKLETFLGQNNVPIPADIPYEVCKDKIALIQERMRNLYSTESDPYLLEKKYFDLEQQLAKYSTAMMLTDEWAEEQKRVEEEWENSIREDNIEAIRHVRSHMPVNVRSMTEDALTSTPSPSGKLLPKVFARKFKRTNVLQLLRVNPNAIEKMHPSYFEGMATTGLILPELRALYEHLREIGDRWEAKKVDKNVERKWQWFNTLKVKFKELLARNDQYPVKTSSVLKYSEDFGWTMEAEYEGGQSGEIKSQDTVTQKGSSKNSNRKKVDDEAIMAGLRERLNFVEEELEADEQFLRKLFHAEKRTILLEKTMKQAGLEVPEDEISYEEAKAKVADLTEKVKGVAIKMGATSDMQEMTRLEKEYASLSDEIDKYSNAMMMTKEWAEEQKEKERAWEENVRLANEEALRKLRRHMPVNIRDLSEDALINTVTPNGKKLPQKIGRKFKRTNILTLLRMDPSTIELMHPSSLESMRTSGLTLTERRALHEHLKALGVRWKSLAKDKMAERKWMWHESLRSRFRELATKYEVHFEKYGSLESHPNASRDDPIDYSEDYGFPEEAQYNVKTVAKSNLLTMEDIKKRREEETNEE